MASVLLVTCADWPDGEPEGHLLTAALAARGHDARWVVWDDPDVDWAAADRIAVRATWDYTERLDAFLPWARSLGSAVLNGADCFAWNTDKAYLLELAAAGLPVVPTTVVEGEEELPAAIAAYDVAVVKPTVGAGGRGVVLFDLTDGGPPDLDESGLGPGPWVVQQLVESVRTEGEHSVFVLGGEAVAQVVKRPAGEEIRVHPHYGGATEPVPLDPTTTDLARRTVAAAESVLGTRLAYARVDLLRLADGTLAVSELEATEPGLYLDLLPDNADRFADVVDAWRPA